MMCVRHKLEVYDEDSSSNIRIAIIFAIFHPPYALGANGLPRTQKLVLDNNLKCIGVFAREHEAMCAQPTES